MLIDVKMINTYHKPYADSTLNNMRKSDLIAYVRTLEHNYNVAVSFNEQQAKNFEKLFGQKNGYWFFTEYEYFDCSVCGGVYYNGCDSTQEAKTKLKEGDYYKYCPHCGAKMGVKE